MGKMPDRWAGWGAGLALAALAGVGAFVLGSLAGERLAFGFTFDWYVHEVEPRYPVGDVLLWVGVSATAGALLALSLLAPPTQWIARFLAKRLGHAPPRVAEPTSMDVHAAKLALLLANVGGLAALALYVYFQFPVELVGGALVVGAPYGSISPGGYAWLMGVGAAVGASIGALLAVATTYAGVVDGTLVPKSDRNLIARISLVGARNPLSTVAAVLALTLVAGHYATTLTTNVDVADVLPRGDPNTVAAHNLTDKFKSSFTQQVTFQFRVIDVNNTTQRALFDAENANKLPDRIVSERRPLAPDNITDELYVRAMAETVAYVLERDPFVGAVGAPELFKLVNWTLAGGQDPAQNGDGDAAFSLPPTDQQGELRYELVHNAVFNVGTVYAAVDAVISPDWRQAAILVTIDPTNEAVSSKRIGERALEVRDAWVRSVERGETTFAIFGPDAPPQFTVDLPIANAHASELAAHDFKTLLPIIGVFVAVTLFVAFRNVVSVVVTFSSLAVAVTWTFGAMGALGIPLNTINLAVVPLIMGVGIDYGIHMMNEFQEFRAKGMSADDAWRHAGGGSALALFVGALTTSAGLLVMVVSPSLLVAQLGLLGNIALASCYLLSILFIPAMVTLLGGARKKAKPQPYAPSRLMPAFATAVSRSRVLVVVVLLLLAGAAYASAQGLRKEAFGDPPRNWLPDDPLRQEHEKALEGFYGSSDIKANVLIIEGDLTDPDVHAYIDGLTATLRRNALAGEYNVTVDGNVTGTAESRVIADTLRDLPFLVRTYLTVRDGAPGAGQYLGSPALQDLFDRAPPVGDRTRDDTDLYPATPAEMEALLDELFASPLRQFGNLFIDKPDYQMTVIVFSVQAATYEDAEGVWNEVRSAIVENEPLKPEGTTTSYFGNTAINYLFVAKQVPWLNAMSMVTIVLIVVIVFLFTRALLPTIAVAAVSALTSILWYGLLPTGPVDIGLAINLTLPLIFISAMGSDYALHLAMRCQRTKDTRETFESVGKGVLFSFITTMGAFLIFTQISDLSGRRSIVGTVLAIAVVFAVTLLVVPILFPVKKREERRSVPVAEARKDPAAQPVRTLVVGRPERAPDAPETGPRG